MERQDDDEMIDDEQLSTQPPAEPTSSAESRPKSRPNSKGLHPVALIVLGVVIFIVCSFVQSAGGTSMFTTAPPPPNGPVMRVLIQATWWPGWFISVACILIGVTEWWKRRRQA